MQLVPVGMVLHALSLIMRLMALDRATHPALAQRNLKHQGADSMVEFGKGRRLYL